MDRSFLFLHAVDDRQERPHFRRDGVEETRDPLDRAGGAAEVEGAAGTGTSEIELAEV